MMYLLGNRELRSVKLGDGMEEIRSIFDSAFLRKLEQLRLNTRKLMNTKGSGIRKSRSKGSSVEFSDYREYTAGDDFRRIDWNAYGRFEKLFVKLFMEERQARINIFLDTSASMDWGTPHKGIQAKRLSAAIAYIGLSNFDSVSLFSVNHRLVSVGTSMHGKRAFRQVLDYLEPLPFEGTTALNKAVTEFNGSGGAGLSFIISDFMSLDGMQEAMKYLQYRKQDVLLCQILAPEEISPAVRGGVRLLDRETGEARDITVTDALLRSYDKALTHFINDLKAFCFKRGITHMHFSSDVEIENVLTALLGR